MISAAAILMLCNGIRISLKSKKYNQRNRVCHGVHDTPFSFLHFFHRISRMNRRYSCLSDYSRNFAELWPLANGSRPIYAPVVFVTQISQMTQIFLRVDYFVPQISQIYTDFSLCGLFCHANFTDDTDFSLCGLFCHADFADDADFSLWRLFRPTDFTDIHRFFFVGLFPTSVGICTDRIGRLCENP